MPTANELEPQFLITLQLDGEEYAPTDSEIAQGRLETGLRLMEEDGVIVGYTIEKVKGDA